MEPVCPTVWVRSKAGKEKKSTDEALWYGFPTSGWELHKRVAKCLFLNIKTILIQIYLGFLPFIC